MEKKIFFDKNNIDDISDIKKQRKLKYIQIYLKEIHGFNITTQTILFWINKYRVGTKIFGRWYITIEEILYLLETNVKKNKEQL